MIAPIDPKQLVKEVRRRLDERNDAVHPYFDSTLEMFAEVMCERVNTLVQNAITEAVAQTDAARVTITAVSAEPPVPPPEVIATGDTRDRRRGRS